MQIKNIKIENFKGVESLVLEEPKKSTVFMGPNGTGKTSILEAIRALITGVVPPNPIRLPGKNAFVSGNLYGNDVEWKFGAQKSVKVNGKATTQKTVFKLLSDHSGRTMDDLEIATSSKVLAAMNAGDLATYLVDSGLIPAETDVDTMLKICLVDPQVEAIIRAEFPTAPVKFNLDAIGTVYDKLYAERTDFKRRQKEYSIQAVYEGTPPTRTVENIDKALASLNVREQEIASYDKLYRNYEVALANRERIVKRIEEIEAVIKTKPMVSIDSNELKALNQQEVNCAKSIMDNERTLATFKANIDLFKATLQKLNTTVCPISNKLVCSTDKTVAKAEISELLDQNMTEAEKKAKEIAKLRETHDSIRDKVKNYRERESAYMELKRLHDTRRSLKESLPPVPEAPAKPAKIENLAEEKAALTKLREEARKYSEARNAQAMLEKVKKQIELYNAALDVLSPKSGIREAIIKIALDPIVKLCNERAKSLKLNFIVGMKVENGIHISCCPNTALSSDMLPLECVSSGEQAYVLFLVLNALNTLTGIRLLLLDDLDKLDKDALNNLFGLLSKPEVRDEYDHILISMVNHEDSENICKKYVGTAIDEIKFLV